MKHVRCCLTIGSIGSILQVSESEKKWSTPSLHGISGVDTATCTPSHSLKKASLPREEIKLSENVALFIEGDFRIAVHRGVVVNQGSCLFFFA